mgnify:CR=1 FL=1
MRVEFFGDEIEKLSTLHPVTGEVVTEDHEIYLFPASHYVAGPERMERAIGRHRGRARPIDSPSSSAEQRLLEAQRLRMRTSYDIEMMRQIGTCSGIENYSRHIDGRGTGQPAELPARLLPVGLPPGHRRVARHGACRSVACTKATCPGSATLVEHGFRLPSAMDNRPLRFEEFVERIGQTIYLSATPGNYELAKSQRIRRTAHPTYWAGRSSGDRQAHARPDRRSDGRDPECAPSDASVSW